MRFGRDPTTDPFGGCFGLNSVNYPPGFPAEFPPSAVCRRLQYAEKDQRPDQWQLDARKWSNVRLCRLLLSALLRIFAEQSVLRPPFRQGYFLPGGWALALAWGRARGGMGARADEEEGACGARSKRPRLNPQLARASFLPLQEEARSFALSRDIFLPGRRSVDAAPFSTPIVAHVSLANVSP